jgi:hypothetical protein
MLFKSEVMARIKAGEVSVAFRKWRRPTVKAGGTLTTPIGVLDIEAVEQISESDVTEMDASRAGYESAGALLAELRKGSAGEIFRIRFCLRGPDPRVALRERADLTDAEFRDVDARLRRLDAASPTGPWTLAVLEIIAAHAGMRAGDLAPKVGQAKPAFKMNVRKLKNLGLTESLETGYKLSPRGNAAARMLRAAGTSQPNSEGARID